MLSFSSEYNRSAWAELQCWINNICTGADGIKNLAVLEVAAASTKDAAVFSSWMQYPFTVGQNIIPWFSSQAFVAVSVYAAMFSFWKQAFAAIAQNMVDEYHQWTMANIVSFITGWWNSISAMLPFTITDIQDAVAEGQDSSRPSLRLRSPI